MGGVEGEFSDQLWLWPSRTIVTNEAPGSTESILSIALAKMQLY